MSATSPDSKPLPPPDSQNRFVGWVVKYDNKPGYKGIDAFLKVKCWLTWRAEHTYSLSTCTHFDTKESAVEWAKKFSTLLGEGHSTPEVLPVWEVKRYTLSDPNGRDEAFFREMENLLTRGRPGT